MRPLREPAAPDPRTDLDIEQTVRSALALQQAGRLADAEQLYRQILAIDPNHLDSLHLLGVVVYHSGRNEEALALISRAIALNDQVANFHCNAGLVLLTVGRPGEA